MKKLLFIAFLLALGAAARAGNLTGYAIIETGEPLVEGLSHWTWQNQTNKTLFVERVQFVTTNGCFGASWILRRSDNNLVLITGEQGGGNSDFGTDYMEVRAGDYLDLFMQAPTGAVFIWSVQ